MNEWNLRCRCGFEVGHITSAGFRCFPRSPNAVTFRAEISESRQLSASQLVSFLEAWVSSGPAISIQAQLLSVDSTCAIAISLFSEEECQSVTSSDAVPSGDTTLTVVVVTTVLVLILVLAITVSTALLLMLWRRKRTAASSPSPPPTEPEYVGI